MADDLPLVTIEESYAFFEGTLIAFLLLTCFGVMNLEVASLMLSSVSFQFLENSVTDSFTDSAFLLCFDVQILRCWLN